MIELRNLTFAYAELDSPVLKRVNLKISRGEFVLICGTTGSGKSTLLKAINGLAPHFTGGTISGSLFLDGLDRTGSRPNEISHLVGFVNQQPERAFVTDTVEEELTYGMEQLGFSVALMRQRVTETADRFGLTQNLATPLAYLSGGMQQRVAIASAIAAGAMILLLDEPTSALDNDAADETLRLLHTLAAEHGITVVIAEHRIERVLPLVGSVILIDSDGSVSKAAPREQFGKRLDGPIPVVLSRMRGWNPIALSATEAREQWSLAGWEKFDAELRNPTVAQFEDAESQILEESPGSFQTLELTRLQAKFGNLVALQPISLTLWSGTTTVVMGENGAGKTSLLWAALDAASNYRAAMIPQVASDLLFLKTVSEELAEADKYSGSSPGTTGEILRTLVGRINPHLHPRDLSSGQQLALVLAIQINKGADLVILDEPTRGLDFAAKRSLAKMLRSLTKEGKAVLLATHDIEFATLVSDSVLLLERGHLVKHGLPQEFFCHDGLLPSQLALISQHAGLFKISQLGDSGSQQSSNEVRGGRR